MSRPPIRRRRVCFFMAILLVLAVSGFAQEAPLNVVADAYGSSGAAGSCLNEYNNCLNSCDAGPFGPFTKVGCRVDRWVAYYTCVLNSAMN